MREVDPQSEPRLTESLRRLAASSQQSAPPELGAGLLGEFRRHHARRRRVRRIGIAGIGIASLIVCLAVLLPRLHKSPSTNAQKAGPPATSVAAPEKQAAIPPAVVPATPHVAKKQVSAKSSKGSKASTVASRAFVALPGYDPTVPLDELHVVRVQLPASALWQIGAPMPASAGTHNVTADFVVSQGGTPYAVRLVQ